jgi:DNA-binding PadR family transcriptional regulator
MIKRNKDLTILTKLEELFMLAIFHHKGPANLMDIRKYLLDKTGKDWAIASLYIALDKLKKQGFVESYKGKPKPRRGGKALRYYLMTESGTRALEKAWSMQAGMWKDFISALVKRERNDA